MRAIRPLALVVTIALPFVMANVVRADDVTVSASGGNVKIKGDADGNTIMLDQLGLATTQLRVTAATTTINGVAGPLVLDDVTGGLTIDLGAGDDALTIAVVTIPGAVKIKLGAGQNGATLNGTSFGGKTAIDLGKGDGTLALCGATFTEALSIKTGVGAGATRNADCGGSFAATANGSAIVLDSVTANDTLTLKGSKGIEVVVIGDSTVQGVTKIALGSGADALSLCTGTFSQALSMQLGNVADATTGHAHCSGSHPVDTVGPNAVAMSDNSLGEALTLKAGNTGSSIAISHDPIGASASLKLGSGVNLVSMTVANVGESLSLKSGNGVDLISIDNLSVGENATIKAGGGANSVQFTGTVLIGEDLTVVTGNDADSINTTAATVGGTKTIKHGKGADTVS